MSISWWCDVVAITAPIDLCSEPSNYVNKTLRYGKLQAILCFVCFTPTMIVLTSKIKALTHYTNGRFYQCKQALQQKPHQTRHRGGFGLSLWRRETCFVMIILSWSKSVKGKFSTSRIHSSIFLKRCTEGQALNNVGLPIPKCNVFYTIKAKQSIHPV